MLEDAHSADYSPKDLPSKEEMRKLVRSYKGAIYKLRRIVSDHEKASAEARRCTLILHAKMIDMWWSHKVNPRISDEEFFGTDTEEPPFSIYGTPQKHTPLEVAGYQSTEEFKIAIWDTAPKDLHPSDTAQVVPRWVQDVTTYPTPEYESHGQHVYRCIRAMCDGEIAQAAKALVDAYSLQALSERAKNLIDGSQEALETENLVEAVRRYCSRPFASKSTRARAIEAFGELEQRLNLHDFDGAENQTQPASWSGPASQLLDDRSNLGEMSHDEALDFLKRNHDVYEKIAHRYFALMQTYTVEELAEMDQSDAVETVMRFLDGMSHRCSRFEYNLKTDYLIELKLPKGVGYPRWIDRLYNLERHMRELVRDGQELELYSEFDNLDDLESFETISLVFIGGKSDAEELLKDYQPGYGAIIIISPLEEKAAQVLSIIKANRLHKEEQFKFIKTEGHALDADSNNLIMVWNPRMLQKFLEFASGGRDPYGRWGDPFDFAEECIAEPLDAWLLKQDARLRKELKERRDEERRESARRERQRREEEMRWELGELRYAAKRFSQRPKDAPFDMRIIDMLIEEHGAARGGALFEGEIVRLLKTLGFEGVRQVGGSDDWGVDIVAERRGVRYAIQCKCYNQNLNIKPLQEIIGGCHNSKYHCDVPMLITNRDLNKNARNYNRGSATPVLVWNRDILHRLFEQLNEGGYPLLYDELRLP